MEQSTVIGQILLCSPSLRVTVLHVQLPNCVVWAEQTGTQHSYTLRGTGFELRMLVFEEGGVLPMGIIYNVAIPTMAIANTSTIMISSKPASEDSPMNRMMQARYKDTGMPGAASPLFIS